jgi:hypothetical protein
VVEKLSFKPSTPPRRCKRLGSKY